MSKRALVIGFGVSGKSAAKLLDHHHYQVDIYDDYQEMTDLIYSRYHQGQPLGIYDVIVVSPGIAQNHPVYHQARLSHPHVISEIELALGYIKQTIIGVTGTNGKTTVTSLITHVLNQCHHKALALGNIGSPLSTYALAPDEKEILVIELSSFQLEQIRSKKFKYGVILNITPDHLDRYESFNDYARAKLHLASLIQSDGKCFASQQIFDNFSDQTSLILCGDNNQHAAYAILKEFGISKSDFEKSLLSFSLPAHRLEFVAEINKVRYYNDSKATNCEAVIYAVNSLQSNLILIVGGSDKGLSFTKWKYQFPVKVKSIIAIGQTAIRIQNEVGSIYPVLVCDTLQDAVNLAAERAEQGSSVLLSPGCASFDMFSNFEERGEKFKELVHKLSLARCYE